MDDLENYWLRLPIGYSRNAQNHYYDDIASTSLGTWQPEVYPLAQHLLNRGNFECLVDIGAGNGAKLDSIDFRGRKVGIDFGSNLDHARANYTKIEWIERDLNLPISELEFPRNTMFICSDVIEHLDKPAELLKSISVFLNFLVLASLFRRQTEIAPGVVAISVLQLTSHIVRNGILQNSAISSSCTRFRCCCTAILVIFLNQQPGIHK